MMSSIANAFALLAVGCCCCLLVPSAGAFVLPPIAHRTTTTTHHAVTHAPSCLQERAEQATGDDIVAASSPASHVQSRRDALSDAFLITSSVLGATILPTPAIADVAAESTTSSNTNREPFVRQGKGYGYSFIPPPGFTTGKKPVQTHLDEINFTLEGVSKYQFGVTVDPVRIQSFKEFGTPEEVAARVVTAEVNRDGIFEVTLAKDPVEDATSGAYAIDYVSDGKRGKKRFVTRIFIQNQKLYVLTAQVKEEEYEERAKEIAESVDTFRPL